MTSDPQYEYSPITEADGIRLIELQPAQAVTAPLRCSLIHKKLSLCGDGDIFGHYIALSYVWGNPEKSKNILVDGRPLGITSNLHNALSDLRDENRALIIWADGVCINQRNDAERAMQIGLMGKIYASAPHTIIYLGSAESTDPESMCLAAIREGGYAVTDERLSIVFMREWFTRVWVFQEFVFSRNPWLQCGRRRIQWNSLLDILGLTDVRPDAAHTSGRKSTEMVPENPNIAPAWLEEERYHIIRDMQRARKLHLTSSNTSTTSTGPSGNYMVDILRARRGFGVTDPRDMIFAHVGFASDGQHEDLAVDYSKSTVQVYESSALYIAKAFGLSTLLECVGRGASPERIRGLPSWVPDWGCKIPTKSYPVRDILRDARSRHYLIPTILQRPEPGILSCILPKSDTVRFTSSTLSVQRIPQASRQNISSRLLDVGVTSDSSFLGLKFGITRDRDLLTDVYQVWSDLVNDQNILPPDLLKAHKNNWERNVGEFMGVPFYLLSALRDDCDTKFVDGKRLARMASGRLALVPESVQEGDIIAELLHGPWINARNICYYLFHPIQPDGDYSRIDDRIYWSAKQLTEDNVRAGEVQWPEEAPGMLKNEVYVRIREAKRFQQAQAIIKELEGLESSVLHCRFLEECFLGEEEALEPQEYNPSKSGIFVAIH